jgi:AcrR family transcriptional regulator
VEPCPTPSVRPACASVSDWRPRPSSAAPRFTSRWPTVSAVSVQGISDAAGVSPRTFFNHFRSKDEALLPDFPDFRPEAAQAFLDGDEPDLFAALATAGAVGCMRAGFTAWRIGGGGPDVLRGHIEEAFTVLRQLGAGAATSASTS